ncbi:MAG: YggT family protein [Candidatus Omnitrophica bacterium]|nr:YggT family protein [Candidatus Omnitrophota bacterium]MDD5671836.1 YggT family protein [Candidatus Omnitrophota bacterium]
MFIFGELFGALAVLVSGICQILYWLMFARIIISWFPVDPYHGVVQFLIQVTDPILSPFRRLPFLQFGMLDLSPFVAFIALFFFRNVAVGILVNLARHFGASY